MDIGKEIKNNFRSGTTLIKLIYINVAVFLMVFITGIFSSLTEINWAVHILSVPADLTELIFRPWSLISYMFLHEDFLHILFNLLWLFWFGKIFLQFLSQRQLLGLYVLGGLFGALFYIGAYNIIPAFSAQNSYALGASASVMAVVIATAYYMPDFEIFLLFFGKVKIKYIAAVAIVLDILGAFSTNNQGGHIAHLGGAVFGWLFIYLLKQGKDISVGFNKIMDKIVTYFKPRTKTNAKSKSKSKMKTIYQKEDSKPQAAPEEIDYTYNKKQNSNQDEVDRILDKIRVSGYSSLTPEEKQTLFDMKE